MSANQIYLKTIKFCIIRFLVGFLVVAVSIASLAGLVYIEISGKDIGIIGYLIWAVIMVGVGILAHKYLSYMIKAAHVAVIAQAVATGLMPDDPLAAGMTMVKNRFATANVYYLVNNLVGGAVSEIYKVIGKARNALDFIPGREKITHYLQVFVKIALGSIDECCLGYTFIHPEENAFKSACDGVCIYFQNIKTLLKKAGLIALIEVASVAVLFFIPKLFISKIFFILNAEKFIFNIIAYVLALLLAVIIEMAFIEPYILTRMMYAYMEVVPQTVLSFDLYGKLCDMSNKFKQLFQKVQEEVKATVA